MSIMTVRGNCPYNKNHCHFCSASNISAAVKLRFRGLESVLTEVKDLKKQGIGALAIYDDEVIINKKRDLKMFRKFKDLDMKFRCMLRANAVTKQELRQIKEYGCVEICIGVESADQGILINIDKGISIEENTRFVEWCHEIGLNVKTYLIAGLPGESFESMGRTRDWLKKTQPDSYDLSTFVPYPGSEIYENRQRFDIKWDEKDLQYLLYHGEPQYGGSICHTSHLSAEEITELKEDIEKEFPRGIGGKIEY